MRTYDPADCIRYVHLAQDPAAPPRGHDQCHRLPAGYPNASLRARLGTPRAAGTRPALVLVSGGSAGAEPPAPAGAALRRPVSIRQKAGRAQRSVAPSVGPAS